MSDRPTCRWCHKTIRPVRFALGVKWAHDHDSGVTCSPKHATPPDDYEMNEAEALMFSENDRRR